MGMDLTAIIVDDEPLARQGLADHLLEMDDVDVVASCADGFQALEAIEAYDPDLMFLDVQMPEMTGFELLQRMDAEDLPAIIFVTAHDEFAVDAFEAAAADYVLKPLGRDRIRRAVDRARRLIQSDGRDQASIQALLQQLRGLGAPSEHATRLKVRNGEHIEFIKVDDVEWFEADGNYIVLHQGEAEDRIRATLTGLEEALNPNQFVRVHRSVIVNLDHMKEVQPWFSGDYIAIMKSGEQIRVSRRYKDQLLRDVF